MFAWPTTRRAAARPHRSAVRRIRRGCIGGWDDRGRAVHAARRATRFDWFRGRMLGGRTNHWGRISLRFGPDDFRRRSLDGLGDDWPISYDDVKPYYDKVDTLIGVFGSKEGLPNDPDGIFLPPPEAALLRAARSRQAADRLNITCIPSRLSILTRAAQRPAGLPLLRPVRPRLRDRLELLVAVRAAAAGAEDRQAAHHHQRDGARGARSTPTASPTAWPTSTSTTVRENHGPRAGRRAGGERVRVGAAAAQLEIDAGFPHGLANSSGVVGRYLTDSTGHRCPGIHPEAGSTTSRTTKTASAACTFTCRGGSTTRTLDFPRGYHIEIGGGRRMPSFGFSARSTSSRGSSVRQPVVGGYGEAAEGRLPALLRSGRRLRRPRRDDPQRGQLLRDRSGRRRHVGHPGAAVPLEVARPRDQPGEAHAGDVPRRSSTRWAARRCRRCPTRRTGTASSRAGGSSTRWARRGWGTIRRRRR